jgi:tetratricopeptide (TPR) repeat protein
MSGEDPVDDEVSTRLDTGWSLCRRGHYREALLAAETLLETSPQSPHAWLLRCAALLNLRQWPEVIAATTQVERLLPDNREITGRALLWKGDALDRLHRYSEALVALQGATERLPTEEVSLQTTAWIRVSYCLGRLKRHSEAVEAARRAIKSDPTEAEAWFVLAHSCRALRRRREALDALERTLALDPLALDPLALDPYHPQAGGFRLVVLLRLGRLREAWSAFKQLRATWAGTQARWAERRYGPASLYEPPR